MSHDPPDMAPHGWQSPMDAALGALPVQYWPASLLPSRSPSLKIDKHQSYWWNLLMVLIKGPAWNIDVNVLISVSVPIEHPPSLADGESPTNAR